MRRIRAIQCVAAFLVSLLAGGCVTLGVGEVVMGSGKVAEEARPVARFDVIDVAGSGRLIFRQGDKESLTIKADDNVLPY
ncbi:MAG TPA: hypothetical protein VGI81_20075, partial [Tepidisphaeraceae bacterium]